MCLRYNTLEVLLLVLYTLTAFGRLELEAGAGVVWEKNTVELELELAAEHSDYFNGPTEIL